MIDSYHLFISEKGMLLRRQSGMLWWRRVEAQGAWHCDAGHPASLQLARLMVKKKWRSHLHVYVSSGLCKFMAINLPSGLKNDEERRAAGQAQMQHQLGLSVAEWVCAVDVAAAHGKSVVCALRISLLDGIRALAVANNFQLVSVKPFVAGIWNEARALGKSATGVAVLMVVENTAFTVMLARDGIVESINALTHDNEPDLVEREIRRVGLALGTDAADSIQLALLADTQAFTGIQASRILRRRGSTRHALYPDFRDLAFAATCEGTA